ncbi:MAG TPA: hypothetical protein VHD62_04540 [Opitutaceae bacterium]|nr:hypothetical protein [Opitutaceae bacterium]
MAVGYAAEPAAAPQNPVQPDDPAWRDLRDAFARRPAAGVSDFEERRWFTFKKTPTVLHGVARVSTERGLSLAYAGPPARIVIIDDRGLLLREAGRDSVPPADVRTGGPDGVLLHLLRFDLKALAEEFDISGERTGAAWSLTLLPRTEALRRTLGQIAVAGEGTDVRRIELRRSATQRVEILIAPPQRLGAPFTADELRLFFR